MLPEFDAKVTGMPDAKKIIVNDEPNEIKPLIFLSYSFGLNFVEFCASKRTIKFCWDTGPREPRILAPNITGDHRLMVL